MTKIDQAIFGERFRKAPRLVVVRKRMHEKNMDNLSMEAARHKYEVSLWIRDAVNAVECQEIEHKKWI